RPNRCLPLPRPRPRPKQCRPPRPPRRLARRARRRWTPIRSSASVAGPGSRRPARRAGPDVMIGRSARLWIRVSLFTVGLAVAAGPARAQQPPPAERPETATAAEPKQAGGPTPGPSHQPGATANAGPGRQRPPPSRVAGQAVADESLPKGTVV